MFGGLFAKWRGRGGVVSAVSGSTGGAIDDDADVDDKAVNDTGDETDYEDSDDKNLKQSATAKTQKMALTPDVVRGDRDPAANAQRRKRSARTLVSVASRARTQRSIGSLNYWSASLVIG